MAGQCRPLQKPARFPMVLSIDEVEAMLAQVSGVHGLMVRLAYGLKLRLMECLRLRVKDVDLSRREILVRDGKGAKDRVAMLPSRLVVAACIYPTRSNASIRQPVRVGRGSGYFRRVACRWIRPVGLNAGIMRMKKACSERSRRLWHAQESPSPCRCTRCAISSPRICWSWVTTSAPCRSYSVIRMCRRP